MEFSPVFLVVVLWIFLYSIINRVAKNKKQASQKHSPAPKQAPEAAPAPVRAAEVPGARVEWVEVPGSGDARSYQPLRPTLVSDGSLAGPGSLAGSLDAMSMEGVDPCHDEQAEESFRRLAPGSGNIPASGDGLQLSWTGNEVVRGFVYGEVLKRRVPTR